MNPPTQYPYPYGLAPVAGATGQGQPPSPAPANPPAPGAPAPDFTNAPTYAQPGGATPAVPQPGAATGTYAQMFDNNQAFRVAQVLKALGFDTMDKRLSYTGSVISGLAPKVFDAWRETQGLGGSGSLDPTQQLATFANVYNSPGALGNIAQSGQNAIDWLMGPGQRGIGDQELMPLIEGFNQLVGLTQNDTMNRYRRNLLNEGEFQFGMDPSQGTTNPLRFVPFLQNNPIFKFLTGQR